MLKHDKIEKLDNGNMIVEVLFDVAKHGHNLGKPRNYDMNKYKAMLESDKTKKHLGNGYGLIFYSHDARDPRKNYLPHEKDKDGSYQLPVGRMLEADFVPPTSVKFKALILDNPMGKEIQKLIESGVGGFSLVNNIKDKLLIGADYVLSPNFSSNRVLTDETCKNGLCNIRLDDVVSKIEDELFDSVKSFLDDIGENENEVVFEAIMNLEKQTDEYKKSISLLDEIQNSKMELEIEHLEKLTEMQEKLDSVEAEKKELIDSYKDKYNAITSQLDSLGFSIDGNDKIIAHENALNSLFKVASFDDVLNKQYGDIQNIRLKRKQVNKDKLNKAFGFNF